MWIDCCGPTVEIICHHLAVSRPAAQPRILCLVDRKIGNWSVDCRAITIALQKTRDFLSSLLSPILPDCKTAGWPGRWLQATEVSLDHQGLWSRGYTTCIVIYCCICCIYLEFRKMKYDSYSSDVGIQEFYKLFKYVSSKSAKVLLPGNLDIIDRLSRSHTILHIYNPRIRENISEAIWTSGQAIMMRKTSEKPRYLLIYWYIHIYSIFLFDKYSGFTNLMIMKINLLVAVTRVRRRCCSLGWRRGGPGSRWGTPRGTPPWSGREGCPDSGWE